MSVRINGSVLPPFSSSSCNSTMTWRWGVRLLSQMALFSSMMTYCMMSLAAQPTAGQQLQNPALAKLKDIIPPEKIGLWPLAPGFYIVTSLIVLIIGLAFVTIYRHKKKHAGIKQGLVLLKSLPLERPNYPVEINSLLKRIAMHYIARHDIAKLDGDAWLAWLMAAIPEKRQQSIDFQALDGFLKQRYQAESISSEQAQQLQQICIHWLKLAAPYLAAHDNSDHSKSKRNALLGPNIPQAKQFSQHGTQEETS